MPGSDDRPARWPTAAGAIAVGVLGALAWAGLAGGQSVPATSGPSGRGPLTSTAQQCAARLLSLTISTPITSPVCLRTGVTLSLQVSGAMHDGYWSTRAEIDSPKVLRLLVATRHGLTTMVRVQARRTGVAFVHVRFVSQMNGCTPTPCTPVPGFDIDQAVVVTNASGPSSLQRGALVGLLAPATSAGSGTPPTPGTVSVLNAQEHVVAIRSVGQDGLALFALRPGQYSVRVSVPIGPGTVCQGAGLATVIAGMATTMNLGCPAP